MKILRLFLVVFHASPLWASELIVDWSLNLENPKMYESPPLHLASRETESTYSVRGSLVAEGDRILHRYMLPAEIVGECVISLDGGMEPKWPDGSHQILIPNAEAVVRTKMPATSISFVFKLTEKVESSASLELHLFRISEEGNPLATWGYVTDLRLMPGKQVFSREFIVPFAGMGKYVAYIIEVQDGSDPIYLYAKQFSVSSTDLVRHDQRTTIDDLLNDERKVRINFSSLHQFSGRVALGFVNNRNRRHVRVGQDGSIIEVYYSNPTNKEN
jgi:hypothetical protein